MATISAVLYANTNHPELKISYPNWSDRCKQILKKWRALPQEKKGPFLQQARDNRSALRMKKAQQVSCFVYVLCLPCHFGPLAKFVIKALRLYKLLNNIRINHIER